LPSTLINQAKPHEERQAPGIYAAHQPV